MNWIGYEFNKPGHVPMQCNDNQKEREIGPTKINMEEKYWSGAVSAWVELMSKAMAIAKDKKR